MSENSSRGLLLTDEDSLIPIGPDESVDCGIEELVEGDVGPLTLLAPHTVEEPNQ